MNSNEFLEMKREITQLGQKLDILIASNVQKKTPTEEDIEDTTDVEGAALILRRSISTIYSKSSKGEIPSWNDGGRLCFSKKKLIAWKRKNERKEKKSPLTLMTETHNRYKK